jgi:hypothetical protein
MPHFLYPWTWPTALLSVHLVERLEIAFNPDLLKSELAEVERAFGASRQMGPHHDGRWNRIGLVGPSGDPDRSYSYKGEAAAETPVLALMPSVRDWLRQFNGLVQRAILSSMDPGCHIRWHRDPQETADRSTMRLHLPVITNEHCVMEIGHERVHLSPGSLWYSDFAFPHRVFNRSDEVRTHIMIDLTVTERTRQLLPARYWQETQRRRLARKVAAKMFDFTERLHAEGRYAARFRREREEALANGRTFAPPVVGMLKKKLEGS